jgi:hypothetical protein
MAWAMGMVWAMGDGRWLMGATVRPIGDDGS